MKEVVMKKFIAFLLLSFLYAPIPASAQPLKVVATFTILSDLANQVGGDLVDVKALVGPDGDAHVYKPTPDDSKALSQANLVIVNGLGMEGWVDRLIAASGYKGRVVIASTGIMPRQMGADEQETATNEAHPTQADAGKTIDPHAWQDVSNARIYVQNITDALCAAMPEKATIFRERSKAYDAELAQLDSWVRTELAVVPASQRKIITSHDAFGYFGAAYGVTFIAPQGISTEVEPTATQVAKLIEQMKAEKVRRVFIETMGSPRLVTQLAKDAGADVGKPIYSDALSHADGPAPTYIAMFHYNIQQFKEAMLLNGK
ncbi:MAG: metal ABC transporter substrate-binding protein [Alphaproteobacteria bacterium]